MPLIGYPPCTVTFTDTSSPDVYAWHWYFGDGDESTDQNPTHVYSSAGSFTVTLEVWGAKGRAVMTDLVTIEATPGTSTAGWEAPTPATVATAGENPAVMLRLSNDGGKTWISEQMRTAGRSGEYWRRVRWNRLGMARRRVFEVSVSDPIPWRITGAYLKMAGGK